MGVTELRRPASRGDGHEVAVVVRSDARSHSHERATAQASACTRKASVFTVSVKQVVAKS